MDTGTRDLHLSLLKLLCDTPSHTGGPEPEPLLHISSAPCSCTPGGQQEAPTESGPAPAVVGVWGADQQVEHCSLLLFQINEWTGILVMTPSLGLLSHTSITLAGQEGPVGTGEDDDGTHEVGGHGGGDSNDIMTQCCL